MQIRVGRLANFSSSCEKNIHTLPGQPSVVYLTWKKKYGYGGTSPPWNNTSRGNSNGATTVWAYKRSCPFNVLKWLFKLKLTQLRKKEGSGHSCSAHWHCAGSVWEDIASRSLRTTASVKRSLYFKNWKSRITSLLKAAENILGHEPSFLDSSLSSGSKQGRTPSLFPVSFIYLSLYPSQNYAQ